jgi:hypothetical protein
MKKIIALAVAGAFVAPVYAVEVSVSGEVETTYSSSDGTNTMTQGTQDITVSFVEELDNGMTVSGRVTNDSANGSVEQDSLITVSGGFGAVQVGKNADLGGDVFDAKSEVASAGGYEGEAGDGVSTQAGITYQPNLGIAGLSAAIGYGAGAAANTEVTGYGVQYSVGGVTLAYGVLDTDIGSDENIKTLSAAYSNGPVYIGVDSIKNQGGLDGYDTVNIGLKYTMGAITLEAERFVEEGISTDASYKETTDTMVGVNYAVGGGLEVYAAMGNVDTASSSSASAEVETTYVGIEYKF